MEKAIHIAPKSDAPHIALALAYEHAKSLDRAILHLQEAAKEIPVSADIQYQLGRLTLKRGHSDEAVKHLNQALKINPELSDALNSSEGSEEKRIEKEMKQARMAILIADDESSTRKVLRELIEAMGLGPVIEARNGKEATQMLEQHKSRIELIISDREMPEKDGLEFLADVEAAAALGSGSVLADHVRRDRRAQRAGSMEFC